MQKLLANIRIISFKYRINRIKYIGLSCFWMSMMMIATLSRDGASISLKCCLLLLLIISSINNLALNIRRIHDINCSAWWLLLELIPGVGLIVAIALSLISGTKGYNRFGEQPAAAEKRYFFLMLTPLVVALLLK